MQTIHETLSNVQTKFISDQNDLKLESNLENNSLNIKISSQKNITGDFGGMLAIDDGTTKYNVPVMIHVTKGTINTKENDGTLTFDLYYPNSWSYAKISLSKKNSDQIQSISLVPQQTSSLTVYESGEYWIEAQITTPHGIDNTYDEIVVKKPAERSGIEFIETFGVPIKP